MPPNRKVMLKNGSDANTTKNTYSRGPIILPDIMAPGVKGVTLNMSIVFASFSLVNLLAVSAGVTSVTNHPEIDENA